MTVYFMYDNEKYFVGNIEADKAPDNSTSIAPDLQTGYWSKFTGKKWVNEKIPETVMTEFLRINDRQQATDGGGSENIVR